VIDIVNLKPSKYFFIAAFVLMLFLSFLLFRPFAHVIAASVIISYLFYGIYERIDSKIGNKNISALIVTLLVIIAITIPLAFVIHEIMGEASLIYTSSKQMVESGRLFDIKCNPTENSICAFVLRINEIANQPNTKYYIQQSINKLTQSMNNYFTDVVFKLPRKILDLFIMFFLVFYLLKDGEKFVQKIGQWLPIKKRYQKHILLQFKEVMWAVVYGIILVAILQGFLGGIGFFVSGVVLYKTTGIYSSMLLGSPVMWGIFMALGAMIPFLGTPVVWLPVTFSLLITGILENNANMIGVGIGLLIYCVIIVSSIDNLIKPHIIGSRAKLHPALVVIGIFGGIFVFGIMGIFIGPLVLGILATFIKIYEKERNELLSVFQ
jgi:predicted PurR-regulated permease PerM